MNDESRQRLVAVLDSRDESGRRTAVPVFGNGLNIQACRTANPKRRDPWTAAMDAVIRRLDPVVRRRVRRWPESHQARYDSLDEAFASPASHDEPSEFQETLGAELTARHEVGRNSDLYSAIAAADFPNILTTNVDEVFPLAVGARRRKPGGVYYNEELYRKSVMRFGPRARATDVWQMHGSASMPGGIRLGIRRHAATIAELEMFRIELLNAWPRGWDGLDPPAAYARSRNPRPFSWYKHFMVRPLVFIGSSLDPTAWPLWWLLHQRYRVFAVFDPEHRPATLALTARTEPLPHLAHSPAGIEQIEFATFDDLWNLLRTVIASE